MPSENAPRSLGSWNRLPGHAPYTARMAAASAEQAGHLVSGAVQDRRAGDAGDPDHDRHGDPFGLRAGDAADEPADEAAQRLVAFPAGEPGPAALHEQAAEPPLDRVVPRQHEAEQHRERESAGCHEGLPELAREKQVRDEDERDELDAGGDADPRALPPAAVARVRLAQIPQDERHQHQVDLAEVQGPDDRLGPE